MREGSLLKMPDLNKNLLDKISNKTIAFYPGPEHLFLSYGIFYINRLYARNTVILIVENYSQDTLELIKELFEKIIVIQLKEKGGLKKHFEIKKIAKDLIHTYHPDYLFSPSDKILFAVYLFRYGKENGTTNLCFLTGMMMATMKDERILHLKVPQSGFNKSSKPFRSATDLKKIIEMYFRHFLHYYVFPIMVFEKPFKGQSSSFLRKGTEVDRDGDKFLVFSSREKKIRQIDGVREDQLEIIGDPLKWNESRILINKLQERAKVFASGLILIILEEPVGLLDKNFQSVDFADYLKMINKMISLLREKYPDKKILVKPHPNTARNPVLMQKINRLFSRQQNIEVVADSSPNPHLFIFQCDLFIGEVSTFLLLASSYSNKTVVSINFFNRFLGDIFKGYPNILYFDDLGEFREKFIASLCVA